MSSSIFKMAAKLRQSHKISNLFRLNLNKRQIDFESQNPNGNLLGEINDNSDRFSAVFYSSAIAMKPNS